MRPVGRRSEAFFVPLKIWSNAVTFGEAKDSPLIANLPAFYPWERVSCQLAKDEHLLTNEIFRLMVNVDVSQRLQAHVPQAVVQG